MSFYSDNTPYEKIGNAEPVSIADEVPFEIPGTWEWARLADLCEYIQRGKSPKYSPIKKYPVVAQKCNQWSGFSIEKAQFIEPSSLQSYGQERILQDQDLMWNSTGLGTLGRMAVYYSSLNPYELAVADSHVTVIRAIKAFVSPEYLYFYFASPCVQTVIEDKADGTTKQKELATATIKSYLIPLPPLNEQHRILKKLNEILPVVEKYGAAYNATQKLQSDFPIFLKKSILQMAIQGKLVPQDPSDEPAEVLLERIREEKVRLVKEGKLKKDKHESVIFRRDNSHYEKLGSVERCIDDEMPFEVPNNWCWTRLKNIVNPVSARRVHQSDWKSEGVPFYRAREIAKLSENGFVNNELFISKELYEEYAKSGIPKAGDIMVTAVGTLGKAYIVKESDVFYYKDASVICFENYSKTNPEYLGFLLQTPYFENLIKQKSAGTTVGTITLISAREYLIPMPPIEEQKRIVGMIKRVLPYCERI